MMDPWQRNLRMIHHINEFLDLDSAKSNLVDEFIALFNAIREGLTHIDEDFYLPDSQINMLFLSKLKSRPQWSKWAKTMMRGPAERISFQELARLARAQEKAIAEAEEEGYMVEEREDDQGDSDAETDTILPVQQPPPLPPPSRPADHESEIDPMGWNGAAPRIQSRPRAVTQDDINAFVVRKMSQEGLYRSQSARGHMKRPSQEQINHYVVEQMRREQDRRRVRSYSQPEPRMQNPHHSQQLQRHKSARTPRCRFCSDLHPSDHCWRRWRVAVEAPHANFAPKRVEFRTEAPGQPPMYRTGFTLY